MKHLLLVVLLSCLINCSDRKAIVYPNEKIKLYNEVFSALIYEQYYQLNIPDEVDSLVNLHYDKKKITEEELIEKVEEVKEEYKKSNPKPSITIYSAFFERTDSALIAGAIETHLSKDFPRASSQDFLNTLCTPVKLYTKDFNGINYLRFKTFEKNQREMFDGSMGVLSFSDIYFNKAKDKAAIYYEFFMSRSLGKGNLLLLIKVNGKWTVKEEIELWIS